MGKLKPYLMAFAISAVVGGVANYIYLNSGKDYANILAEKL